MPKQKSSASSATRKKQAKKKESRDAKLMEQERIAEEQEEQRLLELEEKEGEEGQSDPAASSEAVVVAELENGTSEAKSTELPKGAAASPAETAEDAPTPKKQPTIQHSQPHNGPVTKSGKKLPELIPVKGAQRGQKNKKQSKKHKKGEAPPPPRKKVYIPPPKPPRGNVDPVDTYGLGVTGTGYERVPAEKVVLLRLLNKKDEMTVERATEELLNWIALEDEDEERITQVAETVPVWIHHLPRLLSHASRRVRLSFASIFAQLLYKGPPSLLALTLPTLLSPATLETPDILSSLLSATFDPDRQVRAVSSKNWESLLSQYDVLPLYVGEILESLNSNILDFTPATSLSSRRLAKMDEDERINLQEEQDRRSNQLAQSLDAYAYLLQYLTPENREKFEPVFESPKTWRLFSSSYVEASQVRRAIWRLLGRAVQPSRSTEADEKDSELRGLVQDNLKSVSREALPALFGQERDQGTQIAAAGPLFQLCRANGSAWKLAGKGPSKQPGTDDEGEDEISSDSSSTEDEDENGESSEKLPPAISTFLSFLQLGCLGNSTFYSFIPSLISTIPSSLLPLSADAEKLELLFSSYWAAYAGRALDSAGPAGLATYTGCLLDLVRQLEPEADENGRGILIEQISTLWQYYLGTTKSPSKSSTLSRPTTVEQLGQTLSTLSDAPLEQAWEGVSTAALGLFEPNAEGEESDDKTSTRQPQQPLSLLGGALESFSQTDNHTLKGKVVELERQAVKLALKEMDQSEKADFVAVSLQRDSLELLRDEDLASMLDDSLASPTLSQLPLVEVYLRIRNDSRATKRIWYELAQVMRDTIPQSGLGSLLPLIQAFAPGSDRLQAGSFDNAGLDEAVLKEVKSQLAFQRTLDADASSALQALIRSPEPLLSVEGAKRILTETIRILEGLVDRLLHASFSPASGAFILPIQILSYADVSSIATMPAESPVQGTVFEVAYLLPQFQPDAEENAARSARQLWGRLTETSSANTALSNADLATIIASRLSGLLSEPRGRASVFELAEATSQLTLLAGVSHADIWAAFLPSQESLDASARVIQGQKLPSVLSVLEPLVAPSMDDEEEFPTQQLEEQIGKYLRETLAWMSVLADQRSLVVENSWFIRHAILVNEVTQDLLNLNIEVSLWEMEEVRSASAIAERLASYVASRMASSLPNDWHNSTVQTLRTNGEANDAAAGVLKAAMQQASEQTETGYLHRVLSKVLRLLLRYSDASQADAERWLAFAQTLEKKNIGVCLALVDAIRDLLFSSPRYQRYQSEIASTLSGVKPSEASSKGAPLLRLLVALSPAPTSEEELLPVNRAMFLVQSVQKWITSEEEDADLDDDMHVLLVQMFTPLVSIIQGVTGSHWDVVFDLIDSNIETAAWTDASSLPGLFFSIKLLQEIKDRSSTNTELRTLFRVPLQRSLALAQKSFVGSKSAPTTAPVQRILESVSQLLQGHVGSEVDSDTLDGLLSLLLSSSRKVQLASFDLLQEIIKKKSDDLVLLIETRRSEEDAPATEMALPTGLMKILPRRDGKDSSALTGYLLAWLCVMQYFRHSSTVIKAAYSDQLRKANLVSGSLLPTVYELVEVSDRSKGIDLSGWAIEEYHPDLVEEELASFDLSRFASYVYFRALQTIPSLIRSDWESYKNKQLSMATANFTSKYFSPILIERELMKVREEETKDSGLRDENMAVKVLPAVGEVRATYTVDEQPMEIFVRIPSEFPLIGVEVKDGKRIGVPEATWRAWLLNVQLVITSQNGSIADALILFKANASRHFEGVEACAICYSVISVTDRSLPSKRCRTCKNLFHPSCLFKWFSTSHGSSCPLCRSLF